MMKYIRIAQVTNGSYYDGHWTESVSNVIASGATKKLLKQDVKSLTKRHTNAGSVIDFGFINDTTEIVWGPRYKIQKDNK